MRDTATIYCDGYRWNSTLSDCVRPIGKPLMKCDFNSGNFCGWSQKPSFANWNMVDAKFGPVNATIGTGMPHLNPYSDHYLHFESSNLPWNTTGSLFSPVYEKHLGQNSCFSFMFSMNGANMGSLGVYVMSENNQNLSAAVEYFFFVY